MDHVRPVPDGAPEGAPSGGNPARAVRPAPAGRPWATKRPSPRSTTRRPLGPTAWRFAWSAIRHTPRRSPRRPTSTPGAPARGTTPLAAAPSAGCSPSSTARPSTGSARSRPPPPATRLEPRDRADRPRPDLRVRPRLARRSPRPRRGRHPDRRAAPGRRAHLLRRLHAHRGRHPPRRPARDGEDTHTRRVDPPAGPDGSCLMSEMDIHKLTGAYAMDALDELERARFEQHLATCEDCRAEVAELRETAALLSETVAVTPPASLRDSVLAGISQVRPLAPEVTTSPSHHADRPAARGRGWVPFLVAAAVALIVGVGAVVTQPWAPSDDVERLTAAEQVLQAPDAQEVSVDLGEAGRGDHHPVEVPRPRRDHHGGHGLGPVGQGLRAVVHRRRRVRLRRADARRPRPDGRPRRAPPPRPPRSASPSSPTVAPSSPPATRSPCSTCQRRRDQGGSSPHSTDRRLRGRRADGGLDRLAHRPRDPVRGRRPARRPRRHPRRRDPRRRAGHRHRLHRPQPAHLPHAAAALRRARGGDPALGDVAVGQRRRHRCRVRRCARRPRPVRPALLAPLARALADAARDPALPPPRPGAARRRRGRHPASAPTGAGSHDAGPTRRCASSSATAASRPASSATSWSRSSRPSGRATRRPRWTTRPATCSPSSSTTGCSASSARRSGAPSPAARDLRRRGGAGLPEVRLDTKVTSVLEVADGVEVTDGSGATTRFDAVVVATHPSHALAHARGADRPPARGCSRRCPTAATRRSCTPTPRCCRRARRPRVVELSPPPTEPAKSQTQAGRLRSVGSDPSSRGGDRRVSKPGASAQPQRVTVTYDLTRLQRLAHRHPLPRHPRRRGPRRPGDGHRPDGVRAPALHARVGRRARAACPRSTPSGSPSPGPTTAGASTRTVRARASPPRPTSACPWARTHAGAAAGRVASRPRSGTPGARRSGAPSSTARPSGSSTSTTCPTTARWRGSRRATTSARPTRTLRENVEAFLADNGVSLGDGDAARHDPDGRPPARARLLLQPDQRLLVLRRPAAPGRAWSSRCTTPTATGTPTSSTPTSRAAPAPTRRCTSRRSTASTAPTTSPCPIPTDRLHVAVTLRGHDATSGARRSAPASPAPAATCPSAGPSAPRCAAAR